MKGLEINPCELAETGSWSVSLAAGRLQFGEGALSRLGELVRELDCNRVLLVTDTGIRAAGHVDRGGAGAQPLSADETARQPLSTVV